MKMQRTNALFQNINTGKWLWAAICENIMRAIGDCQTKQRSTEKTDSVEKKTSNSFQQHIQSQNSRSATKT